MNFRSFSMIAFFFGFHVSSAAFSAQLPLVMNAGSFVYTGTYEHLQTQVQEIAYRKTKIGEARYQELLSLRYNCEIRPGNIAVCKKMTMMAIDNVTKTKIQQSQQNVVVTFGEAQSVPTLIEEAPEYNMWKIQQSIHVGEFDVQTYRIYQHRDFESVWLNQDILSAAYVLTSQNEIRNRQTFDVHRGNETITYVLDVKLLRKNEGQSEEKVEVKPLFH